MPSYKWDRALLPPDVKRLGLKADHSRQPSAKVKYEQSFISTKPPLFVACTAKITIIFSCKFEAFSPAIILSLGMSVFTAMNRQ